ncbi:hypothetical protein X907_0121 [Glycocaulis alkaliphilus]|uniref:Uncharacterized protein n=1 Tax=Glycocaulis alkaliphilus TaxID=1434191 RepID=A0A3T0E5M2_9PROT|nr:DUF2975 domain-containing protein [Glycocaulis alkaliphilus]AZU02671.1 hypothetical protein X907_0121 [Glycocaulis alkaliphilus]GGB79877.1 hypothetical protein GCM10007417_19760 [Glycocaulis alkaliphilus]
MRALSPGFLTSLLKIFLDVAIIVLWGLLVLASLVTLSLMAFGIFSLTGMGPDLPDAFVRFLQLDIVIALPLGVAAIIAILFITDRLRRIVITLVQGDPFVPENAGHLRAIALAIAIYQIIRYGAHGIIALIFTVFGRPVESGVSVQPEFGLNALNIGAWIAVIALLVLSEVFREGTRLRDEQKLTI